MLAINLIKHPQVDSRARAWPTDGRQGKTSEPDSVGFASADSDVAGTAGLPPMRSPCPAEPTMKLKINLKLSNHMTLFESLHNYK